MDYYQLASSGYCNKVTHPYKQWPAKSFGKLTRCASRLLFPKATFGKTTFHGSIVRFGRVEALEERKGTALALASAEVQTKADLDYKMSQALVKI